MSPAPAPAWSTRSALNLVLLFSVVGPFADCADCAYEGARGINGPFLDLLWASA